MYLLVGLGNPGKKYLYNRHNVGFMAIDSIIEQYALKEEGEKFKSIFYKGVIGEHKLMVIKPMTFMNDSGKAVLAFAHLFKIDYQKIIVIHDELDLPVGKVRLGIGNGAAGHNGLRSINSTIPNVYSKLRVGIGRPLEKELVSRYVLEDFDKEQTDNIQDTLKKISKLITILLDGNKELFSSELNKLNKN